MKLKKIAKVFNRFGKAVCLQTAERLLGDKQLHQMFRIIVACVAMFMGVNVFAAPYVTNVVAKQRYPWRIVDINCEVCAQRLLELISKEIPMRKHFSNVSSSKNDLKLSVKCFMSNED